MRPKLKLLDDALVERIVDEAREVLCTLGVEIHNQGVLDLLADHGAAVDAAASRAVLTPDILDRAIASGTELVRALRRRRRADPPLRG